MDGLSFYWHDLRMETRIRVLGRMGGASVMIWAAFSFYERSRDVVLTEKQNAEDYCTVLDQALHPLVAEHVRGNYELFATRQSSYSYGYCHSRLVES